MTLSRHIVAALLACGLAPVASAPAKAFDSAQAMARDPDLFDADTGYRVERMRAPTPTDAPGATVIDAEALAAARDAGALVLDVVRKGAGTYVAEDGAWIGHEPRRTIAGAVWLPGLGAAEPDADMAGYIDAALERLLGADRDRPVIVYCLADCWASWNAARRLAARGHNAVLWYPLGIDGWVEKGRPTEIAAPFAAGAAP
jgi:PQQ-dependent catabolism-associated CXXCW motif protein